MQAVEHEWSITTLDRWSWTITYGPHTAGLIRWICELHHPHVTIHRMLAGLNTGHPTPARTWTWRRFADTNRVELCHNGKVAAEIEWTPTLRNKTRWSTRIVDALNANLGPDTPYPEPMPPRQQDPIPGDFDFHTMRPIP